MLYPLAHRLQRSVYIRRSRVWVPPWDFYFPLHKISIVSRASVHSRKRCCCPRMVGNSCVNSSPPSAAYMRQRTSAPRHYPNQCWRIVNYTPGNKFQWNKNRNSIIFIQVNAIRYIVCQNGYYFVQGEMSSKTKYICSCLRHWITQRESMCRVYMLVC